METKRFKYEHRNKYWTQHEEHTQNNSAKHKTYYRIRSNTNYALLLTKNNLKKIACNLSKQTENTFSAIEHRLREKTNIAVNDKELKKFKSI